VITLSFPVLLQMEAVSSARKILISLATKKDILNSVK